MPEKNRGKFYCELFLRNHCNPKDICPPELIMKAKMTGRGCTFEEALEVLKNNDKLKKT